MELVEGSRKVNTLELSQLATKCFDHVMELYPFTWEELIRKSYKPQIETLMLAKGITEYEAASDLYNNANQANKLKAFTDKVFYMASLKIIIDEKITQDATYRK